MNTFKKPESLYDLITVSSPALSEDGKILYYVKTTIARNTDRYRAQIFSLDIATGQEAPLLDDASNQTCTAIQGSDILFLSDKLGQKQVYHYSLTTGIQKQVTFTENGVSHVQWVPGSQHFLFVTRMGGKNLPMAPFYRFNNLKYQTDGLGFTYPEEKNILCEQAIGSLDVTVISPQATGYGLRRIADSRADGTVTYFEKVLAEGDDYNHDSGIFAYTHAEKTLNHVTKAIGTGIFSEAAVSPDGKHLAMVGNPLPYETANQFRLYLYTFATDSLQVLVEGSDIQFADNSVSDYFQNVKTPILQWHPSGDFFHILTSDFGCVHLNRVNLDGTMTRLSPEAAVVKEFVVAKTGEVVAFISRPDSPLTIEKFANDEWTTLWKLGGEKTAYASYRDFQYTATDGGIIHGLMVVPADFDATKKYPTILNIHGGPYTMHAHNFYHEAQVLAANGYLVLLVNPRGSYGYGQEHVYGVYERYGKEDYTDLMTAVDGVVADYGFVDAAQLLVTGGSYGGFMTNWIVTQTNRFKAAVSQRSMSNFVSLFGTSDIGYFFFKNETGHDIAQANQLWEISPLAHVEKVETPLLLIHAKDDLRCPFEQAQQFYTGLLHFGKTAEMLLFPDSHHELSRTGRPSYRVERLRAMLEWFERYRQE